MSSSAWASAGSFVEWFQYSPWGFISFALAILGVLLAVIPLFQMFYGGPDIAIKFTRSKSGEQALEGIGMHINNRPISSSFLRGIGVMRSSADDVVCHFRVCEASSGKEIKDFFPAIVADPAGQSVRRASLGASRFVTYVSFGIVKNGKFYLDLGNMQTHPLQTGRYKVVASVEWAGKSLAEEKHLIVRDSDPYGFWESEQ